MKGAELADVLAEASFADAGRLDSLYTGLEVAALSYPMAEARGF
jgi:hypothetical protein